ncbi:MAG: hypothetical protein EBV03_02710 [Proteobacteria bacterium]|nr:hypothetical protein [Pseudomonadota bacterium]
MKKISKLLRLPRGKWATIALVLILVAFCVIPGIGVEGSRFSGNAAAAPAPEMPPALIPVVMGGLGRVGMGIRRRMLRLSGRSENA